MKTRVIMLSVKLQSAVNLLQFLEWHAASGQNDWEFSNNFMILEISETLFKEIDKGYGSTLINQYIALGGTVSTYNPD